MIQVSAIIPTYNRRELLLRALDSVVAQTRAVDEIIVIDDGSTDGTDAALRARDDPRIRYHWQPNAGVSAARNRGMAMARGRYIALLDSDDVWLPEKTRLQYEFLDARPDFGLVLCDVIRTDGEHRDTDVFHRRDVIREDGWALRWIIHNPSLVPASAMFTREVFTDTGGFDESLRTAEDIDFHLRIARRWRIGVVEVPLVRAMRGHEGLSSTSSTYDDYVRVMERAIGDAEGLLDDTERRLAMARTYYNNARGMLMRRRWRDGYGLAAKAWRADPGLRVKIVGLIPFALRRAVRGLSPG